MNTFAKIVFMRYFFLLLLFISQNIFAQTTSSDDNMMSWLAIGVNKKINSNFSVGYNQTHSLKLDGSGKFNFIQGTLKLKYRKRGYSLSIGTKPTFLPNTNSSQKVYHRIFSGISKSIRFNKKIRGSIAFNFEHHFTQGSKFQRRYYPRFQVEYRNKKLPYRLRPYLSYKLYYYEGGRPLQYYDADGNKTDKVAPNGLHAHRIRGGLSLRPSKKITFSTYVEQQKEFNSKILLSKDINNYNPNTQKIRRKYNNFLTIGATCIVKI